MFKIQVPKVYTYTIRCIFHAQHRLGWDLSQFSMPQIFHQKLFCFRIFSKLSDFIHKAGALPRFSECRNRQSIGILKLDSLVFNVYFLKGTNSNCILRFDEYFLEEDEQLLSKHLKYTSCLSLISFSMLLFNKNQSNNISQLSNHLSILLALIKKKKMFIFCCCLLCSDAFSFLSWQRPSIQSIQGCSGKKTC